MDDTNAECACRVALILTLIVLAKLAGMTTPRAIAELVRLRAGWLRKVLPGTRESFPCAATYSNVLQALDAEQVNEVVTQLVTRVRAMKRCGDEPSRLLGQAEREEHVHVALDGKTLRGTLGHEAADQRKMHQVALYERGTGLVLKEQVVGEKEHELSMDSQFLSPVWVKERIIESRCLAHPTHVLHRGHAQRRLLPARSPRAISRRCVTTCGSERGTSSHCPRCDWKKKPKGRNWTCRRCGFVGHRDIVGSMNMHLLAFGSRIAYPRSLR